MKAKPLMAPMFEVHWQTDRVKVSSESGEITDRVCLKFQQDGFSGHHLAHDANANTATSDAMTLRSAASSELDREPSPTRAHGIQRVARDVHVES